ncbi:exonuclease 1 [Pancytospora epiphaga]|nr:exonuclease 1 [Pancytospora epiphaga]
MGITGLLPIVRPIMKKKHISCYNGRRVGVDGHVWLHGVAGMGQVAIELFYKGETDKHVPLLVKKAQTLASYGIIPIFVFDGDPSVSKEPTNAERRAYREKCRVEAEFYLTRGDDTRARELMKRCVSITPLFLFEALKGLRSAGFEYIVSPYEADAQLVFLQSIGYIDWIMTVDSDLIPYGGDRILYNFNGTHVEEFNRTHLPKAKDVFFAENILDICILSGCDYISSIKGVGLMTAYRKLCEHKTVFNFVNAMQTAGKTVAASYLLDYKKARSTFKHHIVYNPISGRRQYRSGEEALEMEFLGTLENIPYIVKVPIGGDLKVNRHHLPGLCSVIKTQVAVSKPENKEDSFSENIELDTNLTSPYFD